MKTKSRVTLGVEDAFNRLLNANDSFFRPGSSDYLGTGYPAFLYTAEGRFWYVSLTRKF